MNCYELMGCNVWHVVIEVEVKSYCTLPAELVRVVGNTATDQLRWRQIPDNLYCQNMACAALNLTVN